MVDSQTVLALEGFRIRDFHITDYESVVRVWRDSGLHIGVSDTLPEIEKKLKRDPDLFLVAEADGQVVGAVIGAWDGRRAWIYHLAVRPGRQERGIGDALMKELEQRFRGKGALKTALLVMNENERAKRFYAKRGYTFYPEVGYGSKYLRQEHRGAAAGRVTAGARRGPYASKVSASQAAEEPCEEDADDGSTDC